MADINDQLANVDAIIGEVDAQLHTNRNVDMPTMKQKIDTVIGRLLPNTCEQIDKLEKQQSDEVLTMKNRADALRSKATVLGQLLAILQLWIEEKNTIESVIDNNSDGIDDIVDKYRNRGPQPLETAKHDLNALNHYIHDRIDNVSTTKLNQSADELASTIDWPIDETDKLMERYQSKSQECRDIENCLRKDIEFEETLLNEFNSIMSQLNELADRVVTISGDNDLSTEAALAQMTAIQHDLLQLKQRIEALKSKSIQMPNFVLHADAVHLPTLEMQYANVASLVNNRKEDMAACLSIIGLTSTIAKEANIVRESIDVASNMVADGDETTIDQFISAIEQLETVAVPHLIALNDAYEQIPIDATTDEVRMKTLDDCSKLDETVKSLLQSLHDRMEAMKLFNDKIALIIDRIDVIGNQSRDHERISDPNERLHFLDIDLQQLNQLANDPLLVGDDVRLSPSMRNHVDHVNTVVRNLQNRLKVNC